jgi:hypothetical protein
VRTTGSRGELEWTQMTIRSVLLTLAVGALGALIGWAILQLPANDQRRYKRPVLAVCGVVIVIGLAIMVRSLLP